MAEKMMKLQDERKEILRSYRQKEIRSADAIRLLRENDEAVAALRRQQKRK